MSEEIYHFDRNAIEYLRDVTVEIDEFTDNVVFSISTHEDYNMEHGRTLEDALENISDNDDHISLDKGRDVTFEIGNDWGVAGSTLEAFVRCLKNATGESVDEVLPHVFDALTERYENDHGETHVRFNGQEFVGDDRVEAYRKIVF